MLECKREHTVKPPLKKALAPGVATRMKLVTISLGEVSHERAKSGSLLRTNGTGTSEHGTKKRGLYGGLRR
jgi:hypothetical protein